MLLISGIFHKFVMGSVIASSAALPPIYYFKPSITELLDTIQKKINKQVYTHFLVSKTGSTNIASILESENGSQAAHATPITQSHKLTSWNEEANKVKNESLKIKHSTEELYDRNDKKTYKCAIPMSWPSAHTGFDAGCEIYAIDSKIWRASEILDSDNLTKITKKQDVKHNQLYVMRINSGILSTNFKFEHMLPVHLIEQNAQNNNDQQILLSLSINYMFDQYKKGWVGRSDKALLYADTVAASGKPNYAQVNDNIKTCTIIQSQVCFMYKFAATKKHTNDNDEANIDHSDTIELITTNKTLSQSEVYVFYFAQYTFSTPKSTLMTDNDIKFIQPSDSGADFHEIAVFKWIKPVIGFISLDQDDAIRKTQLFVLD